MKVLENKFKDGLLEYNADDLTETVTKLAEEFDNLSAVTFNYLKSFEALGSIITGASSKEQLITNMQHYALRLERPDLHVLTVNPGPFKSSFHLKADPSGSYNEFISIVLLIIPLIIWFAKTSISNLEIVLLQ